jgi:protein gp37
MSKITSIQWADTTVNPIMGCGGCELFPPPGEVLASIDQAAKSVGASINSKQIFKELVDKVFLRSENPHRGHKPTVNTTNIWHLRERFADRVRRDHGREVSEAATEAIRKAITCYAAILHLNKASNILDREGLRQGEEEPREVHPGYAPIFEMVTQFKGRSLNEAAFLPDLLGLCNPKTPWKERLARMIFVSDMGDALSAKGDFQFLKDDLMPAIRSNDGIQHLWLWLTKRPERMVEFAEEIGGFPENVCAMTTLTGPDDKSMKRLSDLKRVRASVRGLSIEPLWDRIPPSKLNLKGIDWVILGGESGSGDLTRPFALEWAEEMRDHCRKNGVAFFMKQLGRNPSRKGQVFRLKDKHGGEWEEWDESLRVREFPQAFHEYRKAEMAISKTLRPVAEDEEKVEFKRHHKIVVKGVKGFWEIGRALAAIKNGKLWKAGGFNSWNDYCRSVAGMSRGHAHRLLDAAEFLEVLKTSPRGDVLPQMEAQVRPILRLPPEQQVEAWFTSVEEADNQQPTVPQVRKVVFEIEHPEGSGEKTQSRAQKRIDLVGRLKEAIGKRKSWEQVEKLLGELEELL